MAAQSIYRGKKVLVLKNVTTVIASICFAIFGTIAGAQQNGPQTTPWTTSCLERQVCELKSEILAGGGVAARASVVNLRGQFLLQYTLPLGIDVRRPVLIRIDNDEPITTELIHCSGTGCTGAADVTGELIQSLKRGTNLSFVFQNPRNQDSLAITFSLSGFTAGYNELVGG